MSREVKELGFEIQALKLELQVLKLRVERQEAEIAELKAVPGFGFVQGPTEEEIALDRLAPEPASSLSSDWTFRLEVAREIGRFLKAGFERKKWSGTSDRDKVSLKNRIYVLVRDKGGCTFTDPVLAFRSWRGMKDLVETKGNLFDSVFVGFSSQREPVVAVAVAGFQ